MENLMDRRSGGGGEGVECSSKVPLWLSTLSPRQQQKYVNNFRFRK